MGRNTITFKSEAPLEDIVGTSNQITGYIAFDPMRPDKGGHGQLSVPASSINTGIPLRNEHLRGADWFDASGHPDIILRINSATNVRKVKSTEATATYELDVSGNLTIKGRTKEVSFPARITYLKETKQTKQKMEGDLLAVRAEFEVTLAEFGINGPTGKGLIGTKVGKSVTIAVSLIATNQEPKMMAGNPCNPCNPCGGKAKNPCNPCGK